MPMDLPRPIADFVRMKNEHDGSGLSSLFTEDAMVVDGGEGKTMYGREDIQAWVAKSISGLHLHTEVESSEERDGEWFVHTVMTGDFKASPARFLYTIALSGDKISALRVEFRGSVKATS
jgi:ketosteroid isomerase-like protein